MRSSLKQTHFDIAARNCIIWNKKLERQHTTYIELPGNY